MRKLTLLIFLTLFQTSLFGITPDKTKTVSPKQKNTTECIDLKKDKDLARAAIEYYNSVPHNSFRVTHLVDQSLLNDRSFIMSTSGVYADYIGKHLRSDRELMLKLIKRDGDSLEFASDTLKADKELVTIAAESEFWSFKFASDSLKNDKAFLLGLIKKAGTGIKSYVSESLRDDKSFMRAGGYNISEASDRLLKDREFILAVVQEEGIWLRFADESLKKDKEIVLAAVKNNGLALEFADDSLLFTHDSLLKDKEIFIAAVDQTSKAYSTALERFFNSSVSDYYISDKLTGMEAADKKSEVFAKNNKELLLIAMSQPNDSYYFLEQYIYPDKTTDDKKMALTALKNSKLTSLEILSTRLQDDKETVLTFVKRSPYNLQYASERLRDDNDIVLNAVNSVPWMIQYASNRLKNDKALILSLIDKGLASFYFPNIGENLKKDPEVMLAYFKKQPGVLEYLDDSFSKKNSALIVEVIKRDPFIIKYADESIQKEKMALFTQAIGIADKESMSYLLQENRNLRESKEYVMKAVSHYGSLIDYASKEIREDPEVIKVAMKTYGFALMHAPSCPE